MLDDLHQTQNECCWCRSKQEHRYHFIVNSFAGTGSLRMFSSIQIQTVKIRQDMESDQDSEPWCNMQFRHQFCTGSGKPMPRLQAAIVWWSFKVSRSLVYDHRITCFIFSSCIVVYLTSNVWHHLIGQSGRKALDEPFDQLQAWILNRHEAHSATCITSGRGAAQQKDRIHVAMFCTRSGAKPKASGSTSEEPSPLQAEGQKASVW